ncbi:MAG: hypothetical protein AAGB51_05165 [Planctomycetota bacterium]
MQQTGDQNAATDTRAIDSAIASTQRRLWFVLFLERLVLGTTVWIILNVLIRLFERTLGFEVAWGGLLLWSAVGAFALAVFASIIGRPDRERAARALDKSAGLEERAITSEWARAKPDGWSKVVVAEAAEALSGIRGRDAVSRVTVAAPRSWPVPLVAFASALALWWAIPELDLLGRAQARADDEARRSEVIQTAQQIEAQEQALSAKLKEAGLEADSAVPDEDEARASALDAEGLRRERLRELTNVREQIDRERSGADGERVRALKKAAERLRRPGPGPMDEFARRLARGDLDRAQAELQNLAERLLNENADPEQREQVKEQLENLAQQLEQAAKNRDERQQQLARDLAGEGIDLQQALEAVRNAAQNPEQLQQLMEQAQGLSEEQRQQIMEQAQGIAQGLGDAQQIAEAMQNAAQSLQQGQAGDGGQSAGDAFGDLANALSQASNRASQQAALDRAAQEAMRQLEELGGGGSPTDAMGQGGEGPNRGEGLGNSDIGEQAGLSNTTRQKADVHTGEGPIIGTRYIYESQIRGESRAEFAEAARASEAAAAEAIEEGRVPPELRESVKRYFGTVREQAEQPPATPEPEAD